MFLYQSFQKQSKFIAYKLSLWLQFVRNVSLLLINWKKPHPIKHFFTHSFHCSFNDVLVRYYIICPVLFAKIIVNNSESNFVMFEYFYNGLQSFASLVLIFYTHVETNYRLVAKCMNASFTVSYVQMNNIKHVRYKLGNICL